MTELYASIVLGTAAASLAAILLFLRLSIHGRRPVLALIRRWVATSAGSSALVVALLLGVAAACFATVPGSGDHQTVSASGRSVDGRAMPVRHTVVGLDDGSGAEQAWGALQAYADKVDTKPQSSTDASVPSDSEALPDVETMIAKLVARLEQQPNDVRGWKMLGWSLLNTQKPADAVTAYETALTLEPDDAETKKALEAAKAALAATAGPPSGPASPATVAVKAAEGLSGPQRDSMIRRMVDRLAARLASSPNDEEGWSQLMRSRMALGERDAAKAALAKALETFVNDSDAKSRLTAAARELGVESN